MTPGGRMKSMARAGLTAEGKAAVKALSEKVLGSWVVSEAIQQSVSAQARGGAQAKVAQAVDRLRDTGDIDNMLAGELQILEHERQHYANTPIMVTSLDAAIKECSQTIVMLDVIRDPVAYRNLDKTHQHPGSRVGDVPNDDARRFFSGQRQRLQSLGKAVGTDEDKKVLKARLRNIERVALLYKAMQLRVLGKDLAEPRPKRRPRKARDRDHDIEPG